MSTISQHQMISQLLGDLEAALKDTGYWAESAPEKAALQSKMPFACDTMAFEQWLQFIFLPRMHELITHQHPLPTRIALLPMAQQCFAQTEHTAALFRVLAAFDNVLGEQH